MGNGNDKKEEALEKAARIGIAAKGTVYILMGFLAALTALNLGGQLAGKKDAFRWLLERPFGQVLVAVVAVGLILYGLWRMVSAITDAEHRGNDAKGIGNRLAFFGSGLLYGGIGVAAAALLFGANNGDGQSRREWLVSTLFSWPAGVWIVGAIGIGIIGKGIYEIYRSLSGDFKKYIAEDLDQWAETFGRVGYFARGVVFGIIGYFFIRAAIEHSASAVGGTEGVFQFLRNLAGAWLMGAVAIGLMGYGVFMFVKARYQQFDTDVN